MHKAYVLFKDYLWEIFITISAIVTIISVAWDKSKSNKI